MDTTPPSPSGPADATRTAGPAAGLRFAFGTLTVLPVGDIRWDRATARTGMLCAPLVGLSVGLCAAALGGTLLLLGAGPLLAAVATVALPAALTRGLHLDGLADVADGLGSGRPADEALRIMRRSDIGPFGVSTLLFVLLTQTAALYELYGHGWLPGAVAATVGGLTARTALTWACRKDVPAARPDGLGATVARSVPTSAALGTVAGTVALAAAALALTSGPTLAGAVIGGCAVILALSGAELLLRHCRRRLGGITGDVLGTLAEVTTTVTLLALTLGHT